MDFSSNESEVDVARSPRKFLKDNYEVLTVLSVFGALAMYFADFTDDYSLATRFGVGSMLVLFLIASGTSFWEAFKELERAKSNGQYRYVLVYGVMGYSFGALLFSVAGIMYNTYPRGSGTLVFSGLLYGSAFTYLSIVLNNNYISTLEADNRLAEIVIQKSAWISVFIVMILYVRAYLIGDASALITAEFFSSSGRIIALVIIHLSLTAIIVFSFKAPWYAFRKYHTIRAN